VKRIYHSKNNKYKHHYDFNEINKYHKKYYIKININAIQPERHYDFNEINTEGINKNKKNKKIKKSQFFLQKKNKLKKNL